MISHKHRIIFVHLKRTAGNSIELSLGGITLLDKNRQPTERWENRLHRGRNPYKKDMRGHSIHTTALEIRKLHPQEFEDFLKFSVVRNPWAQMASCHGRSCPKKVNNRKHFENWLFKQKRLTGLVPRASLFDSHGNLLMNDIVRFEHLAADFERVKRKANITLPPLPHANASPPIDYVKKYTPQTRKYVANLYAEDIDRFDYRFGIQTRKQYHDLRN